MKQLKRIALLPLLVSVAVINAGCSTTTASDGFTSIPEQFQQKRLATSSDQGGRIAGAAIEQEHKGFALGTSRLPHPKTEMVAVAETKPVIQQVNIQSEPILKEIAEPKPKAKKHKKIPKPVCIDPKELEKAKSEIKELKAKQGN